MTVEVDHKRYYWNNRYERIETSRKSKAKARSMWERGELMLPARHTCRRCEESKDIREFILTTDSTTGHSQTCRECVNRGRRERRGSK